LENIFNEIESLKNIYKETQEEMNKILSINPEPIKKIFADYEDKILNQSTDPEYIKYIYNKAQEKILSQINTSGNIKNIFEEINKKLSNTKYLSLLVFDELGLSEKSPTNCLKVLHSKLEMSLNPKEKKQISFIGISNWRLDAAKMNRTIFLAIPEIALDDIKLTVKAIAESYGEDLYSKYEEQYKLLGNSYYNYKNKIEKEFTVDNTNKGEETKKESDKNEINLKKVMNLL
jgi:hypothetical protein